MIICNNLVSLSSNFLTKDKTILRELLLRELGLGILKVNNVVVRIFAIAPGRRSQSLQFALRVQP
jgi:hypothetical protein